MIKGQKVEIGGKTAYEKWSEAQGLPIIKEFYIEDLRKVDLKPWAWGRARGYSQPDRHRQRQRRVSL